MSERPELDIKLDSKIFREYYYLKEELIDFCRKNDLQTTGGKLELTERIVNFLDTGVKSYKTHITKKTKIVDDITLDTLIEENFVCSEKHRAFYKIQYSCKKFVCFCICLHKIFTRIDYFFCKIYIISFKKQW